MGKYLSKLRVVKDGCLWVLIGPLSFKSDTLDRIVTAPERFVTDFASVIRLPFIYAWCGNIAQKAAVLHDLAYRIDADITREDADSLFLEAMKVSGISWFTRHAMYRAVRIFGKSSYHKLKIDAGVEDWEDK